MIASPRDDNRVPSLLVLRSDTQAPVSLTSQPISNVWPLNVAIVDGSGNQITSFGGGTQYTDAGIPPAHPVAPTLVFDNAGAWAHISNTVGLPVQVIGSVPVTGTFWQTTQPVSLSSLPALATGANLIGQISASNETSTVYNGTTALTPKFAKITAASSGNNNLVVAVTSKKIRVLAYNFISNGTVNAKFQSDGAGTPVDKTGLKYCVANMGMVAPFNPAGWFESDAGKTLDINLSAAIAIGGELVYVEV